MYKSETITRPDGTKYVQLYMDQPGTLNLVQGSRANSSGDRSIRNLGLTADQTPTISLALKERRKSILRGTWKRV